VTICNDCVLQNIGTCGMVTPMGAANPCNPFQDGVLDCCTVMGTSTVQCPAS